MEFDGILALMVRPLKVLENVKWARTGNLGGHRVFLAANGAGWSRAAAAVEAACRGFHTDAVISTGFCGACDPKLRIADAVVATEVGGVKASAPPSFRGAASGPIASINHVVQTAKEKAALHASGAIAVEMEAAGVAAAANRRHLPFYCVRAVTDLAGEDMANDFNAALQPDGQFATMHIFTHALHHPVTRLPELYRLRQSCVRAARTLGDFFADCRF